MAVFIEKRKKEETEELITGNISPRELQINSIKDQKQ